MHSNEPVSGRPPISVDVDEILALHYSWTKISELLGISRSTVYRRLWDASISTIHSSLHKTGSK